MSELKVRLDALRNLLHDSTFLKRNAWAKKEKGIWSKLWSAFDNLEDTIKAVGDFDKLETVNQLALFGLLQAMVVQQDAVKHLEEATGLTVTEISGSSALMLVRNIRDETIGHPSNTVRANDKSSYADGTITYTSLSANPTNKELEYVVWSKDGSRSSKVDLVDLIQKQDKELAGIVSDIISKLSGDEKTHRRRFKNESLEELFSQSGYYVQKLWPFERNRQLSKASLYALEEIYRKYKNGIKSRYGHEALKEYGFIPGIVLVVEKLDKVFPKLKGMIEMNNTVDVLDLEVYIESLSNAFDELKVMARETDVKFCYEPGAESL